jgi:pyruvate-formate lyase
VLAVDAETPSTLLAHKAGYIDRDKEIIVGLQTDQPFKRAIFPFGGLRMVEAGLKAAGLKPDSAVHETFTKYRKSHNDGVFDIYAGNHELQKVRNHHRASRFLRARSHHCIPPAKFENRRICWC